MTSFVRVTHCCLFVVRIAIAVEPLKLRIQDLVVPGAVGRWKRKKKKKTHKALRKKHAFLQKRRQQMAPDGGAQGTGEVILSWTGSNGLVIAIS